MKEKKLLRELLKKDDDLIGKTELNVSFLLVPILLFFNRVKDMWIFKNGDMHSNQSPCINFLQGSGELKVTQQQITSHIFAELMDVSFIQGLTKS